MKKLLLLNVFLITALNGMEENIDDIKESVAWADQSTKDKTTTPARVIKLYATDPDLIRHVLNTYYDQDELIAWHDAEHNNLMHIAVEQFIAKRSAADDDKEFHAGYKYLLGYLHQKGVQVNEFNDHHQTPIFLLNGNRSADGNRELKEYLETKLGANPMHVSLQPELRRATKIVKALLSYCPCWGQRAEQHEKID